MLSEFRNFNYKRSLEMWVGPSLLIRQGGSDVIPTRGIPMYISTWTCAASTHLWDGGKHTTSPHQHLIPTYQVYLFLHSCFSQISIPLIHMRTWSGYMYVILPWAPSGYPSYVTSITWWAWHSSPPWRPLVCHEWSVGRVVCWNAGLPYYQC